MPFNINDFSQNITDYGTSSVNKYDVSIALPSLMSDIAKTNDFAFINQATGLINFRAEAVTTPGIALMTVDTNKFGVGPRIKQGYNAVMGDVHIRFLSDANGILEAFFNTWTNLCYNYGQNSSITATFLANYRDQICSSSVQIKKYDDMGNAINTFDLYQAMPTMISPISFDWGSQNAKVKFIVNLTYIGFAIT